MNYKIICGDALDVLPTLSPNSVQCCVTSPPYYGLRDYGVYGQIGLEESPDAYVEKIVAVFREVRRVLRDDGTLWVNLGDSYNGSGGAGGDYSKGGLKGGQPKYPGRKIDRLKAKDLIGIPWMVAFALRADGWYLRQDIIWSKPSCMPESVTDRCTKAHEYIFLLSKSAKYYYDAAAIAEPAKGVFASTFRGGAYINNGTFDNSAGGNRTVIGNVFRENSTRNKRSVWTVASEPYSEAHFATYPTKLIEPCILAGSRVGDTVLDPFNGSGTTGFVSVQNGRNYIGVELNQAYVELAHKRISKAVYQSPLFEMVEEL